MLPSIFIHVWCRKYKHSTTKNRDTRYLLDQHAVNFVQVVTSSLTSLIHLFFTEPPRALCKMSSTARSVGVKRGQALMICGQDVRTVGGGGTSTVQGWMRSQWQDRNTFAKCPIHHLERSQSTSIPFFIIQHTLYCVLVHYYNTLTTSIVFTR